MEPRASSPARRLAAIERARGSRSSTGVHSGADDSGADRLRGAGDLESRRGGGGVLRGVCAGAAAVRR